MFSRMFEIGAAARSVWVKMHMLCDIAINVTALIFGGAGFSLSRHDSCFSCGGRTPFIGRKEAREKNRGSCA